METMQVQNKYYFALELEVGTRMREFAVINVLSNVIKYLRI